MNNQQFIFDFETLGIDLLKGFPVLECAYGIFDADRFLTDPYTFEELVESVIVKDKFDIEHQVREFGYKIDSNTLEWWKSQDKDLQSIILKPSSEDIRIDKFIDNLMIMLYDNMNCQYWWSRSNTFDPIILYRMATDVNRMDELSNRLKHWNVRDTRTFIDAKFNFAPKMTSYILEEWKEKFEAHNSIHDVAIDVMRLQKLIIVENEE